MSLLADLLAVEPGPGRSVPPVEAILPSQANPEQQYFLDELPEELLLHVLSFLEDVDLQTLLYVGPVLKLLSSDHLLWRQLYAKHQARLSKLLGNRESSSELLRRGVIPHSDVRVLATSPREFWESRRSLRRKLTMTSLERRLSTRPIISSGLSSSSNAATVDREDSAVPSASSSSASGMHASPAINISRPGASDASSHLHGLVPAGAASSYPPHSTTTTPSGSFPPARRTPAFSFQRSNHDISAVAHPHTVAPLLESPRKNLERAMEKDRVSRAFVARPALVEIVAKGFLKDTSIEVARSICPSVRPVISRFEAYLH